MHEHLLWDITPPSMAGQDPGPEITLANYHEIAYGRVKHLGNYRLDSREVATEEVRAMRDAGGSALVELTVGGLQPDPERKGVGEGEGVSISGRLGGSRVL